MEHETHKPDTETPAQQDKDTSVHPPQVEQGRRRYGYIDREHPIGGEMSDILRGLLTRVRLPWLLQHYARLPVLALFMVLPHSSFSIRQQRRAHLHAIPSLVTRLAWSQVTSVLL